MKIRNSLISLALSVFLPTMLAAVYFFHLASNEYVSEAKFSIKGAQVSTQPELLGFILGGSGSSAADSMAVREFILSRDMLECLDDRVRLRRLYSDPAIDFLSRLKQTATKEQFIEYFGKRVSVVFDNFGSITTLKVRAYGPQEAKAIADAIIEASEDFVNRISERSQADAVRLAMDEVRQAEEKLMLARSAVKSFRNERGAIDPSATAESILGLVAKLETDLAQANAELSEMRTYMNENSLKMSAVKARVNALETQVKAEKSRLTGKDDKVVSELVEAYQKLVIEQEFAEKRYLSALSALETARLQAMTKSRYLVAIARPSLPDQHDIYRGARSVAQVFGICALAFAVVTMLTAAVRDHSGL